MGKRILNCFLFAALVCALFMSPFEGFGADQPWKDRLGSIVAKAKLKPGSYGLTVMELESGRLLFSQGEKNLLNPASSIKVITAATALDRLGPNHRFETVLYRSSSDLCLQGGGDPSLVTERMWILAEEAVRSGLTGKEENLIVDESLFGANRAYAADFSSDQVRSFTAPISSLSVNFNSLTLLVEPTIPGKPPKVWLKPDLPLFEIINQAKTVKKRKTRPLTAEIRTGPFPLRVTVKGEISTSKSRKKLYRAVPEPALYAGHVLAEHLRRAGFPLLGKIRKGACPKDAVELVRFKSKPLSQIVFSLNKFSNNFIAEMLVRAMGKEPTASSGLRAMKGWLKQAGIPTGEIQLGNGSGLSRATRISSSALAQIVRYAARKLSIGPEFLASLGIGAVDGTLRRRFHHTPAAGKVRAKSGSLRDVSSLTGLVDNPEVGPVVFAFLFRVRAGQVWRMQHLEEALITRLAGGKSR